MATASEEAMVPPGELEGLEGLEEAMDWEAKATGAEMERAAASVETASGATAAVTVAGSC